MPTYTDSLPDLIRRIEIRLSALESAYNIQGGPPADAAVDLPITGLSATSLAFRDPVTGTDEASLIISWDAITTDPDDLDADPVDYYLVSYQLPGQTEWSPEASTEDNTIVINGLPLDVLVTYRVRAVSKRGVHGDYAQGTFTTAFDTVAPNQPSTPTVVARLGQVLVTWDGKDNGGGSMPSDFRHLEVHASESGSTFTPSGATLKGVLTSSTGGDFPITTGLTYGTTIYVRTIAVDLSNNTSPPSVAGSATPVRVTGLDIEPDSIDPTKVTFTAHDIGGITTTFSSTAPTSPTTGDVWYDSSNENEPKRWSGSAWVSIRDTSAVSIAQDALTTADGKNNIYYATTAPVGTDYVVNDLWFDTDDGNKPYRWNGATWAAAVFGGSAVANLDAGSITTGTLSAGVIGTGTISADKMVTGTITAASGVIADAAIVNAKIANGAIDDAKISNLDGGKITALSITSSQIAANAITASKIQANAIDGKTISGVTIIGTSEVRGALIRTATSGQRIEINSTGVNQMTFYPSGGINPVTLYAENDPVWGSSYAQFRLQSGGFTNFNINRDTIQMAQQTVPSGSSFFQMSNSTVHFGSDASLHYIKVGDSNFEFSCTGRRMKFINSLATYNFEIGGSPTSDGHWFMRTWGASGMGALKFLNSLAEIQSRNSQDNAYGAIRADTVKYVTLASQSSERYKSNISRIPTTSAKVDQLLGLVPVSFSYTSDEIVDKRAHTGFIAEEVAAAGLTDYVIFDKEGRPDSLNILEMLTLLVPAIRNLRDRVIALEGGKTTL